MQDSDSTPVSLLEQLSKPQDTNEFEIAWRKFNQKYTPKILAWIRSRGLDKSDAEDVCQDLMVCLLRRLKTFEYKGQSFRGYLYVVAKRAAIDFLDSRRQRGQVSIQEEGLIADPIAIEDEFNRYFELELLEQCMLEVKQEHEPTPVGKRDWTIFWELFQKSSTPKELAERFNLKVPNVYVIKKRMADCIRKRFESLNKQS
jgi:RNA polymerase sigma factor (sigma-70 family)